MQVKYCVVPDKDKFFAFFAFWHFSSSELSQLKVARISRIYMNEIADILEIHFECVNLADNLLKAVAEKLTAAYSLKEVNFVSDISILDIEQSGEMLAVKQNGIALRNEDAIRDKILYEPKGSLTSCAQDGIKIKEITEAQEKYELACKQLYGKKTRVICCGVRSLKGMCVL